MAFRSCIGRRVAKLGCKVIGWRTPKCPQGGRFYPVMELPAALRQAVDQALVGVPLAELASAAEALSIRYRAERRDGRRHVEDDRAAQAYLATRLPATYAAIHASLAALAKIRPGFQPQSLLDVGAGPGTALWAVAERWPG